MPIFEIQDPKSGKIIEVEGAEPPTEQELEGIFQEVSTKSAEERQEGREAIEFVNPWTRPGIGGLQNLAAIMQREESAIAGPILDIQQQKPLTEAFKSFFQGLSGEESAQLGDVFTQAGFSEEDARIYGFASSMMLPTNFIINVMTGGTAKGATTGTFKTGKKFLESVINRLSGAQRKTFKRLNELVDKYGVKRIFSSDIEDSAYIGNKVTPQVTDVVREKAITFDKPVLKEFFKVEDSLIDDVTKRAKDIGLDHIPSVAEADEMFKFAVMQASDDIAIPVTKLTNSIDNMITEMGDIPLARSLDKINKGLKRSQSVQDLLTGSPATITKQQWLQTRMQLNLLRKGDPQITRFVDKAKTVLDDLAEEAGVEGVATAKGAMTIARKMEKPFSKITREALDTEVLTRLNQAKDIRKGPQRKMMGRMLGEDATNEMLDLMDANQILTAGELAPAAASGLQGAPRQALRKMQRGAAEKVTPVARKAGKSLAGKFAKKTTEGALKGTEIATVRSLLTGNE